MPSSLIYGSGEMATLTRSFDWSLTPLGPIDQWPEPLLCTVNLLLACPQPMFLWWGPHLIQFYNDAYRVSIGTDKHPAALGMAGRQCWPEVWTTIGPQIEAVMQRGEALWNEDIPFTVLRGGKLQQVYWTYSYSPVRDRHGAVCGTLVSCTDRTSQLLASRELEVASAALADTQERLLGILQQAPAIFALLRGPTHIIELTNPLYDAFVGHRSTLGMTIHDALPEAAPQGYLEILDRVYATGQPFIGKHARFQIAWEKGQPLKERFLDFIYSPLRDPDGSISGIIALGVDVTEHQTTHLALQRSEERLQLALQAAGLGTWFFNPVDRTFTADAAMQRIFGASQPTGEEDFWSLLLHPDDRQPASDAFAAALAGGPAYNVEYRVLHPEGLRWVRSKAKVASASGLPTGMFATVEDITDRKQTETALHESEERFRLALAAARGMGSFDWIVGPDRVFADPMYCAIAGVEPSIGRLGSHPVSYFVQRMHPEDRAAVDAAIQETVRTGKDYAIDYRFVWNDGTIRWVSASGSCLYDDAGQPIRFPGIVVDITERKLTEDALIRNEKLAAVGRLASAIAHEINNPLESVTNLIYLAKSSSLSPETRAYLNSAEVELRRAAAITSQTLRFHRQSTKPTEISCQDLFSGVLLTHQSRLENASLQVEKRKRAHRPVLCFDGEIRQVLSNLITNALDAMQPAGGRLLVRSREGHDWHGPTPRPGLILTVADTGPGISPANFKKIFEPFYTTKGLAGTGLGLWISKEIADRHKGRLNARTSQRPGHTGTVFTLFLPFDPALR